MNGGWPGGRNLCFLSCFWEFESSLVQEFKFLLEFSDIQHFQGSMIVAGGLAANCSSDGEKNCIHRIIEWFGLEGTL